MGAKFYLLETCVSHVGYIGNYVPPYPSKYLLTEIFLGFAAGLNAFMFWPYRAQPSGIEQAHGAVVTQAGTPDLGYDDVVKRSKILAKLKPILQKTHVKKSKVAIIFR
ncbi:beta-galactosidase [Lactobacillus amylovorus]|uniref:Beta-galactosidase n=1 Tax=Lactobacillus amylovorus TaxID=1604 RepID=A0A9X4ABG7_LACAM|nr:beta-galactosidase [Lactobacillus amylovorus]MDB6255054.1 beta-galactosidase [Lactobacillus amylovorus]MDB6259017.1 beta-galactosidase [Lactobacillus amylovorus]